MEILNLKKEHKPNRKLSQILDRKCVNLGDSLSLNFKELIELDSISLNLDKISKLDLSYNSLSSLSGLGQFRSLTHLRVRHNQLSDLSELCKIKNPQDLLVLSLEGNPCTDHPDFLSNCLRRFPSLIELNNTAITDVFFDNLKDACLLSQKLFSHLSRTEQFLIETENKKQKLRLKIDLFGFLKSKGRINALSGPYWEDINNEHSKIVKQIKPFPEIPSFGSSLRPIHLLKFIDIFDQCIGNKEHEDNNKLFKWLFCEILIQEQTVGKPSLQLFLQEEAKKQYKEDDSDMFERELKEFLKLIPEDTSKYMKNIISLSSTVEKTPEQSFAVPILANNKQYLKIILNIIQAQIENLVESLQDYKDLLLYDFEGLLPSKSDSRDSPYTWNSDNSQTDITRASEESFIYNKISNNIEKSFSAHLKKTYFQKLLRKVLVHWKQFKVRHSENRNLVYYRAFKLNANRLMKSGFIGILYCSLKNRMKQMKKAERFYRLHKTKRIFSALKHAEKEDILIPTCIKVKCNSRRKHSQVIKRKRKKSITGKLDRTFDKKMKKPLKKTMANKKSK